MIILLFIIIAVIVLFVTQSKKGKTIKHKDGNGTIPPLLGYVIFPDENHEEAFSAIRPQYVRLVVCATHNFNEIINRVKWYRKNGVCVLLLISDKDNPENTPNIAANYARHLGSNGIIYECWNEENLTVPPWAPHDNFLEPNRYFNIFVNFRNQLKAINPNIRISIGGLAGDAKDKKPRQYKKSMNAITYRQKLADLGITPLTDYWNFHTYGEGKFYENVEQCRKLDPNKPIIIGEFGSDSDENTKITHYKRCVDRFIANKISIMIVYAWKNGGEWSICSQPGYKKTIRTYKRHSNTRL